MDSVYPEEVADALEAALSPERLTTYMAQAGRDRGAAIDLYLHNTKLSEALYTPLQGIEICVRNAVARRMATAFGPRWYQPGIAPVQHPLTEMLAKAMRTIRTTGKPITEGRIVAELNFGFWVGALGPRYENALWRPALRHAFPHRPRGVERKRIHAALNAVRGLRNRVAHHEPVLHRDLRGDHKLILTVISWVCPHTADWVGAHSRFLEVCR